MGLADLHIHTIYSYDGTATIRGVLRAPKKWDSMSLRLPIMTKSKVP